MNLHQPSTVVSKFYVRYNGWDGSDSDRKEGWGNLESVGNWGFHSPKTNVSADHRHSKYLPSDGLIVYSTGLETANTEFTELYSLLGHKFEAWVERGQYIWLDGGLYRAKPSPHPTPEATARGNNQCIRTLAYGCITGSVFETARFLVVVRTAGVVGNPIPWRGQRIDAEYTRFNSGVKARASSRLI